MWRRQTRQRLLHLLARRHRCVEAEKFQLTESRSAPSPRRRSLARSIFDGKRTVRDVARGSDEESRPGGRENRVFDESRARDCPGWCARVTRISRSPSSCSLAKHCSQSHHVDPQQTRAVGPLRTRSVRLSSTFGEAPKLGECAEAFLPVDRPLTH